MTVSIDDEMRESALDIALDRDLQTADVESLLDQFFPLADESVRDEKRRRLWSDIKGLGVLDPFVSDPSVTEIMVNGPDNVWLERGGKLLKLDLALSETEIRRLIERVIIPLGLRIDHLSPMVDARLPNGSRVNAVLPPLALDGPCITIRQFGAKSVPLEGFAAPVVCEFLRKLVESKYNILISGATSAGKTTLLNALAGCIPEKERVVTVEDAAELRLRHSHVVRLESRRMNTEGIGEVTIRDLVRNALRMRPDRIIVGEFRGPEAFDMLQAMNTGHDGSLSTCHANSPADALRRVEAMALSADISLPHYALREQMLSSIDIVVQVVRSSDGQRQIAEVAEVSLDSENLDGTILATSTKVIGKLQREPRLPVEVLR